MRFYLCKHCENLVEMIDESSKPMTCCGRYMTELIPGLSDASKEKHVPVIKLECNKVVIEIGSTHHPMSKEHFIEWICIETTKGTARKHLSPEDPPRVEFYLEDEEKLVAAYAYCNIHGLWMAMP